MKSLLSGVSKRAMAKEKRAIIEKMKSTKPPSLQDVKVEMEISGAYKEIFPGMFMLLDILLSLPVGTASVERSFSQIKLVKKRLRNRITDDNLARLMCIAIEGPELTAIDFEKILDLMYFRIWYC